LREWKRAALFPLSAGYGPLGREWQNLRALEGLGLTVPRWLAFAQERAWGLVRREVLAVRALPDVEPLERWLERSGVHAWRLRRALAEALGGEIGRAHAGGFCFRKFSVQDVGVRSSTSGGLSAAPAQVPVVPSPLTLSPGERAGVRGAVVEPVFLRVGAGQRQRRLSRRKRTRDLVSLGACFPGQLRATEMLCFFRGYLGRRLTRGDKELVRGVLARYLKVARGGRRGSAGTPPARASQGSTGEKR
jgi:hypothetical protein